MTIITMDMSSYEYSSGGAAEREVHESEWQVESGLQTVATNRLEAGRIPVSLVGEDVEHFLARMYTC